jgi:DNA-binding NtrC family response regulator/pSer/pThr/pTyr-binding forkhead associated (FHA) protein
MWEPCRVDSLQDLQNLDTLGRHLAYLEGGSAMTAKVLVFRVKSKSALWWAFPIEGDMVVQVGRAPVPEIPEAACLTIPRDAPGADTVSRNHTRLIRRRDAYWIEDIGATNPTYVEDKVVMSFRQVSLPFELRLGEVCLKVSQEEMAPGQLREAHEGAHVVQVPIEASKTKTLDQKLRRQWPDIREELRGADSLSQVLAAVRAASTPEAAANAVSDILTLYLGAQDTDVRLGVLRDGLVEALRQSGVDAAEENAGVLGRTLKGRNRGAEAALVRIPPKHCVYMHSPSLGPRGSSNLCIVRFEGELPLSALSSSTKHFIGLSLALLDTFGRAVEDIREGRESARRKNPLEPSTSMKALCEEEGYWGESPLFVKMLCEADRAARRDLIEEERQLASILFVGSPGVGKTALARIIHKLSDHARGPFVEMNCANIVPTLAEALLFGTVQGIHTTASDREGFFEAANNGVLLLDEIGELPHDVQAKMLETIDSGSFTRLGETSPRHTNCHVIAATNADLAERMRNGTFRKDLYDRICTCEIAIPALRERPDDIPLILDRVIQRLNGDAGLIERLATPAPKLLAPSLVEALAGHDWPGNVRELVKNVSVAFRRAEDAEIVFDDLPEKLRKDLQSTKRVHVHAGFAVSIKSDLDRNVKRLELEYCARLMRQLDGAVGKVAERAGFSPQTFLDRRKKDFPELVRSLPEAETARLRELAGAHWENLVQDSQKLETHDA